MLNVILCDDEQAVLDQIKTYLEKMPAFSGGVRVSCCSCAEELLCSRELEKADLLILDICMGELSGLDAAKQIRQKNQSLCLIFLTTMVQYALDSYEVHPWFFLPKPVSFERFSACVTDATNQIYRQKGKWIVLKDGVDMDYLNCRDILYFDVLDHTTQVVMADYKKNYYTRLNTVEQQLTEQDFFRCHKSYLVNLRHIRRVLRDQLIMSNGETVPLSKHRRRAFLLAFSSFSERRCWRCS